MLGANTEELPNSNESIGRGHNFGPHPRYEILKCSRGGFFYGCLFAIGSLQFVPFEKNNKTKNNKTQVKLV
jgi:hypothetical protein